MYLVTTTSVAESAYFEFVILIVPHFLFVLSYYITIFIVLCIKTLEVPYYRIFSIGTYNFIDNRVYHDFLFTIRKFTYVF